MGVTPVMKITGARVIEVRPGAVYDSLNQNGIIDRYFDSYYPPGGKPCVTYFYVEAANGLVRVPNPREFLHLAEAEVGGDVLAVGACRQLAMDGFSLGGLMEKIAFPTAMELADLAHILAHIAMPYAQMFALPFVEELPRNTVFLELAYPNKHNESEAILVFNFASDPILVGNLLRLAVQYLSRWIAGEETHDFLERMRAQTENNDELFVT